MTDENSTRAADDNSSYTGPESVFDDIAEELLPGFLPDDTEATPDETFDSENEDPNESELDDEDIDEDYEDEGEDVADDDDEESTEQAETLTPDDLDLEQKVSIKINGQETNVRFEDLIRGYATNQSLTQKGRELGDLRKEFEKTRDTEIQRVEALTSAASEILQGQEKYLDSQIKKAEAEILRLEKEDDWDTGEITKIERAVKRIEKQKSEVVKRRDEMVSNYNQQMESQNAQQMDELNSKFREDIVKLIPDFSEDRAMALRHFAISKGVPEEYIPILGTNAQVVKFIDEFYSMDSKKKVGRPKKKIVPTKKVTGRKSKSTSQKMKQTMQEDLQILENSEESDYTQRSEVFKKFF